MVRYSARVCAEARNRAGVKLYMLFRISGTDISQHHWRYKEAICADERGGPGPRQDRSLSRDVFVEPPSYVVMVLYVPHRVILQYIIHNARHKSQMFRNVLCNYIRHISRDRVSVSLLFNPFRLVTDEREHFNVNVSQA